jgi:starvation-inducible DNA-binding protein
VPTSADPPNPPLPEDVVGEVGRHLQLTLVELVALALAGKQLQWSAYGREFLSLHRHLDRVVDEWRELGDAVAKRAAAIGIPPDGSAAAVIELGDLAPLEVGFTEVAHANDALCTQLWEVTRRVRQRAELLGDLDMVSQHVLVDVVKELEKQLWMMRAQRSD